MELNGRQKRYLRGLGHAMRATVQIGKGGITPNLVGQLEDALLAHELVKIKLQRGCQEGPEAVAASLCEQTGATLAQRIGHMLLLYRSHPETPVLKLPTAKEAKPASAIQ